MAFQASEFLTIIVLDADILCFLCWVGAFFPLLSVGPSDSYKVLLLFDLVVTF